MEISDIWNINFKKSSTVKKSQYDDDLAEYNQNEMMDYIHEGDEPESEEETPRAETRTVDTSLCLDCNHSENEHHFRSSGSPCGREGCDCTKFYRFKNCDARENCIGDPNESAVVQYGSYRMPAGYWHNECFKQFGGNYRDFRFDPGYAGESLEENY